MNDKISTVAVVGVGAVGTTLASALGRAGHSVIACDRYSTNRGPLVVEYDDGSRFETDCRWLTTPEDVDQVVDWVIVATKLHDTAGATEWTRRLCHENTTVVVAQNGVDHSDRLDGCGGSRIVPALVYLNIDRIDSGHVRVRHTGQDLIVPDSGGGCEVHGLFSDSGLVVERTADFTTASWSKLLANVSANPITTLTGRGCEVLRVPLVARLAEQILEEAAAVGRAEGAVFGTDIVSATMTWLQSLPDGAKTSMLQDREAGRPLEWVGLTGAVVRAADRHNLEVPANRAMQALLSAV